MLAQIAPNVIQFLAPAAGDKLMTTQRDFVAIEQIPSLLCALSRGERWAVTFLITQVSVSR